MIGDDTHNKKRNSRNANQYKGATPIEKNVRVIDEQGNEYEATYPKRAKGLVKNGRARFIDEHTLCLACPPNEFTDNLEENIMEENKTLSVKDIFDLETINGSSSTDCNIPLSEGIPAICFGVCRAFGSHTREEKVNIASLQDGCRLLLDFLYRK